MSKLEQKIENLTETEEQQEDINKLRYHIEQLMHFSSNAMLQNLHIIEQDTGQKLHYCVFLFNGTEEDAKHRCIATDVDELKLLDLFKQQITRLESQHELLTNLRKLNHPGSQAVH